MSPEQITGAPLTAAADLYATGITLFQALTGRLPFLGPDFVAQHLGEAPIAPSEVAPSVDPAWDPLILQLLRKSPDERPASAHALRMAIEKLPLVERDPPPLLLPRGRPALPRGNAAVSTHGSGVEAGQERPRYQFETPLTITASSQLSRALDRYLDRSVIVERFTPPVDPRLERRLLDLAACAAPFLQRLLTWDPGAAVAVFEAPTGRPLDEVLRTGQPGPRELLRLLKGAARALGPLHERGVVHGQLDGQSIVIDEAGNPTLLIAGLPLPGTVQASADLRDLLHCTLRPQRPVDVDQLSELLCTAITAASDHGVTRRELRTAGDLYQLATTLETTLLRRQFFAGAAAPE
jgi:serine/threonine-protein kinase